MTFYAKLSNNFPSPALLPPSPKMPNTGLIQELFTVGPLVTSTTKKEKQKTKKLHEKLGFHYFLTTRQRAGVSHRFLRDPGASRTVAQGRSQVGATWGGGVTTLLPPPKTDHGSQTEPRGVLWRREAWATVSTSARPHLPGGSHLSDLHLSPGLHLARAPLGTNPRAPHRSSFVHTECTLRQLPRSGSSSPHRQTVRGKPSKPPPPSPPPCGPQGHRVPVPASHAPATNHRRHRLQVANQRAARSKPASSIGPAHGRTGAGRLFSVLASAASILRKAATRSGRIIYFKMFTKSVTP